MGVSRSASTVLAYAMKAQNWSLDEALAHVVKRRPIVKPNEGFRTQLVVYEGIQRAKCGGGGA
jgi:protein phosphatase slingshot